MEMYSLTEITGQRANENRTMIIAGQEVGNRTARSLFVAVPVGAAGTLLCVPIMGYAALIVGVILGIAVVMVLTHRSRSGLDINLYQMVQDKRGSNEGKLFICQRPIDSSAHGTVRMILSSSVPVAPQGVAAEIEVTDVNSLFDDSGPKKSARKRKGH